MKSDIAPGSEMVYVVDDDVHMRESIANLLQSVELVATTYDSPALLLRRALPAVPSCIILDVMMPGSSGLDLQAQLIESHIHIPVIFMTGHGDIPMTVQAMKAGAVEFLTKPFRDYDLLAAVRAALQRDRSRLERQKANADLANRHATLTAREREVAQAVAQGMRNKAIAVHLDIAEITVKIYRASIMKKLGAQSLAELIRMLDQVG